MRVLAFKLVSDHTMSMAVVVWVVLEDLMVGCIADRRNSIALPYRTEHLQGSFTRRSAKSAMAATGVPATAPGATGGARPSLALAPAGSANPSSKAHLQEQLAP